MANPEHERRLREAVRRKISSVDLRGFDLSGLRFTSIRLEGANLSDADLSDAGLSGGYFRGCNLHNARLNQSRIVLGDFRDANLSGADLTASDLNGAIMSGANLSNANLSGAKLVKARLNRADFTSANLDRTDLRGVQGLSEEQLASAVSSATAILDERMLARLHRCGDITVARHGTQTHLRGNRQIDLTFTSVKPCFGDVFLLCGYEHPDFLPTGKYGFDQLAALGFQQCDDFFAIYFNGDPVVWVFPLVKGRVVAHHPGPFDGLRVECGDGFPEQLWSACVARFRAALTIPVA